ncbi:hypothetical protein LCGC14_0674860 [marine sediment metagenome]|uniref:HTH cro/C1-type domain-containing protein n=1 Tax=marine sediment metagenome TaxID=412755 RepID=A0A0F9QV43_9ZZZZ
MRKRLDKPYATAYNIFMPDKLDKHYIKDLRKRAKMSLSQMAKKLSVDKSTIHRWEKGESKPSRLAQRQLHRLNRKIDGKRT